ncbi:unnamed protein product, partial [Closterium sp. Naga37s-1]
HTLFSPFLLLGHPNCPFLLPIFSYTSVLFLLPPFSPSSSSHHICSFPAVVSPLVFPHFAQSAAALATAFALICRAPEDLRAWPERLEMRGGQEGLRGGMEEDKAEAAAGAGETSGAGAAVAAVRRVGRGLEMAGVGAHEQRVLQVVQEAMAMASSTLRQHESALHAIAWRLVDAGEASESEIDAAVAGAITSVVAGASVSAQHKAVHPAAAG